MQANGDVISFPDRASTPVDFSTFFAEEHPKVFKALYFVTGNRADAAELSQDAFLKLWERWDEIDRIDDLTAYLFRVALNGSRMRTRAAFRASRRLTASGPESDPFNEIDIREDVRLMLLQLAPRQRAALVLLDLYGYGSEEAARIMGVRPSTVRALATQGRSALRTTGGPHA
ncbi:MAG TPA: RNA polymerase sigma factor [Actinomycetota bacterium]|jgi:RNA polymerase sigma-70 factor (ECF subfamily)